MPLSGITSTCSPLFSLSKTLGPRRGGQLKFPAMPERIVPGSTFEAPSCWGKKQGRGISRSLLKASPERRGGCIEPPIQPPMNLKSSGLPGWLGKSSCSRPVAGESYKFEDSSICPRTFQNPPSNYGCWRSHLHFGEEEDERQVDQDDGGQDSCHAQENPLVRRFQSPLQSVFVRNSYPDPSLCPSFLSSILSSSSSIQTRVR